MGVQKQNKVNSKQDVLQHIPFDDEEYCEYEECKEGFFEHFDRYLNRGNTVIQCVMGHYYLACDTLMDENGMFKFVAFISGMLYMMKHDEVFTDIAYGINRDIDAFETGDYDDLFTPEDLVLIKKDIATIKEYIGQHPELLLDENENLIFTKGEFTKIRKTMMDGNKLIFLDEFID